MSPSKSANNIENMCGGRAPSGAPPGKLLFLIICKNAHYNLIFTYGKGDTAVSTLLKGGGTYDR